MPYRTGNLMSQYRTNPLDFFDELQQRKDTSPRGFSWNFPNPNESWQSILGNRWGFMGDAPIGDNWWDKWGVNIKSDAQPKANYARDMGRVKDIYKYFFPNQQGDLSQHQLDSVLAPIYTPEMAKTYMTNPDPSKIRYPGGADQSIQSMITAKMKPVYDTISDLNARGIFFNPSVGFDIAEGLGGIGGRNYLWDSLGDVNTVNTAYPSITGYSGSGALSWLANRGGTGGSSNQGILDSVEKQLRESGFEGSANVKAICPIHGTEEDIGTIAKHVQQSVGAGNTGKYGNSLTAGGEQEVKSEPEGTGGKPPKYKIVFNDDGSVADVQYQEADFFGKYGDWQSRYDEKPADPNKQNPFGSQYPEQDVPPPIGALNMIDQIGSKWNDLMNYGTTWANQGVLGGKYGLGQLFNQYIRPQEDLLTNLVPQYSDAVNRTMGQKQEAQARAMGEQYGGRLGGGALNKAVAQDVTVPINQAQGNILNELLMGVTQGKTDLYNKMLGLDTYNRESKTGGAQFLSQLIGQGGNLLAQRYWDTSMRNKYGWTPQEQGYVNAELRRLAHEFNMDEMELRAMYERELQDSQGGGFWDTIGGGIGLIPYIGDAYDVIKGLFKSSGSSDSDLIRSLIRDV